MENSSVLDDSSEQYGFHDYVFKFVILGDSGVGKSSIIHYYIHKCKCF